MKSKGEILVTFGLDVHIEKAEDVKGYTAHCLSLDVWSQGDTKREAEKNIKEAVDLFLVSCFERGTLSNVLKECSLKPVQNNKKTGKRPAGNKREYRKIDVLIPLRVAS